MRSVTDQSGLRDGSGRSMLPSRVRWRVSRGLSHAWQYRVEVSPSRLCEKPFRRVDEIMSTSRPIRHRRPSVAARPCGRAGGPGGVIVLFAVFSASKAGGKDKPAAVSNRSPRQPARRGLVSEGKDPWEDDPQATSAEQPRAGQRRSGRAEGSPTTIKAGTGTVTRSSHTNRPGDRAGRWSRRDRDLTGH